jgi:hypothetical protein
VLVFTTYAVLLLTISLAGLVGPARARRNGRLMRQEAVGGSLRTIATGIREGLAETR